MSEPRRVARPDGLRAKIVADKALPRARHFFPISVIRDQLRHRSSSVPDVRLGPYLIGPERIALFGDADQLVIHKACGAFARELAIAGIIGCDEGFPEKHGLRQVKSKTLGAM